MYLGLPVVAFGVNYNKETTENKAVYFNDTFELIKILNNLTAINLQDIAKNMKAIAETRYTWSTISAQYASLF